MNESFPKPKDRRPEILETLRDARVEQRVREHIQRVLEVAENEFVMGWGDPRLVGREDLEEMHPEESTAFQNAFILKSDELHQIFWEHVLKRLGLPVPITSRDLVECAKSRLSVFDYEFEDAYPSFVRAVKMILRPDSEVESRAIGTLNDPDAELPEPQTLWETEVFRFQITAVKPSGSSFPSVQLRLSGTFSDAARAEALEKAIQVARLGTWYTKYLRRRTDRCHPATTALHLDRIEIRSVKEMNAHVHFISECLPLWLSISSRTRTLDRRIQHALNVLTQAEEQQDARMVLALSFIAIESLLGQSDTEEKRASLARFTATLLEPKEPRQRNACEKCFSRLWQFRNKVMHGEPADQASEWADDARAIATSVLVSVLERRRFIESLDVRSSATDMFDELSQVSSDGGQMPGITTAAISTLWRKHDATK
jgi:hypothetical protein